MTAAGGARGPPGPAGPPGRPVASRVGASTWFTVAFVGALCFATGIWLPAWHGVAYGTYVGVLLAVVGGVLLYLGLDFGYVAWKARRGTPIEELPGVAVYHPPARVPGADLSTLEAQTGRSDRP
jgi:hypothetical protein